MRAILIILAAFFLAASPASACLTKPKPAVVAETPETVLAEREKAAAARDKAAQERKMRKAGYEKVYSRCGTSSWVKLTG